MLLDGLIIFNQMLTDKFRGLFNDRDQKLV